MRRGDPVVRALHAVDFAQALQCVRGHGGGAADVREQQGEGLLGGRVPAGEVEPVAQFPEAVRGLLPAVIEGGT
ncbi:hypothetical protein [Streptomyces sp. NPDC054797]